MSMNLTFVRMPRAAFASIRDDADGLAELFSGEADAVLTRLGLEPSDVTAGWNYLGAHRFLAGPDADDETNERELVLEDLRTRGRLGWEATYGPAFVIEPAAVASACRESRLLAAEPELGAFFTHAAEKQSFIVGVVD
jgi:hypothetical protein